MICFEILKNGVSVTTAGVGDSGVLTAIVEWIGRSPERVAKSRADGEQDVRPMELRYHVGGMRSDNAKAHEFLKWCEEDLKPGDLIVVRIHDQSSADPPKEVKRDDPDFRIEHEKAFVRLKAKEFGWEIRES